MGELDVILHFSTNIYWVKFSAAQTILYQYLKVEGGVHVLWCPTHKS